jgi:ferric-dicitrate binding protein FerR (iron transport regulator)
MDTEDNLQSLILKKLSGAIDEAESASLRELLTDPANAHAFEETEKIWNESQKLAPPRQMSASQRWNRLHATIGEQESKTRNLSRLWMRYAAAIIAVIAALYFYNKTELTTIRTASGETKTIQLPDGSSVILNAGSQISYDAEGWSGERSVNIEGEAFFEVRKNGSQFSVITRNARVTVLGTSFNVRASQEETKVSCFTGKVKVTGKAEDKSTLLTAGLGVTVHGEELSQAYHIDDDQLAWMQKEFDFRNTLLRTVFERIGHRYDKRIISNSHADTLRFTGNLETTTLESTLESICLSAGLKFRLAGDSVVIE